MQTTTEWTTKLKSSAPSRLSGRNQRRVNELLKNTFDLRELRAGQSEVIHAVLKGHDTLALMPTGAGKSLCYQVPALLLTGMTVVISPLISLMKDQHEKLAQLQIAAAELNSSMTQSQQDENMDLIQAGKVRVLYVTPERFANSDFLKVLHPIEISLVVVDEAHCVTQWGHDFRPDYLTIRDSLKKIGSPTVLALTATATRETIADIQQQLQMRDSEVFQTGVLRPNLHYEAEHFENEDHKFERLKSLIASPEFTGKTGIIYAATTKAVDMLHDGLRELGLSVTRYHGKLRAKERAENQNQFMSGERQIMVATTAFGMGIDKADIRYVIHFQFPGSLEAYYQESGRAGRDGNLSRCTLFYLKQDKRTQSFFLAGKYPKSEDIILVYSALRAHPEKTFTSLELEEMLKPLAKTKVRVILSALREAKILGKGLRLLKPDLDNARLLRVADEFRAKKEHDHEMLKRMIVYAQSAICRWKILLEYFDQSTDWQLCGHCDNCERAAAHLKGQSLAEHLVERLENPVKH